MGIEQRKIHEVRGIRLSPVDQGAQDSAVLLSGSMKVHTLVQQIPLLTEAIERYDQKIAALFDQHDDSTLFGSFPGAGSALAPRLLAAFGSNRDRFEYASEMQQLSGIAPVTEKSV